MPPLSRSHRNYTVGWICAIEPELIAAGVMLDEIYRDKLPAVDGDSNSYIFGRIGKHNVVIASLPNKTYGISPVGEVVTQMSRSFAGLRVRLLVGIGGGVSRLIGKNAVDIRLGDVVVSYPTDYASGVIQYDLGKTIEGKEWPKRTGTLNKSLTFIRIVVTNLKMNHRLNGSSLDSHFSKMILQHSTLASEYTYQGEDNDILFEAGYRHESQGFTCAECFKSKSISRTPRQSNLPIIYYDLIASGNQVVKDSVTRDYWGNEEGVLCFEMEAAALMDVHPYLVIRGVCDYADSHKNKRWQSYAAATAAAYAKDLLLEIAPYAVQATESPFRGQPESGNVHWMVPKSSNTLFTGRTNILEKLGHSLRPQTHSSPMSEQQRRFVIVGYGGIGKSEVCLKFANDQRQHFWGIFWIDASSEQTARQNFIDIGKMCGANAENFEQVKTWLANTRQSWLLIIDNADNPKIDYAAFFPSGNRGNIILTTRNSQCRDHETIGFEDLDHLDLQDATSLFFKAAAIAESRREEDQKAAEKVVQALGYHTLAIVQAGAFIKHRRYSLKQYPILLKEQEEQLLKYRPEQVQSTYGSVFATFEISATHLESSPDQTAMDALSLLQILGFIHFQEIPELMFFRAWEEAIAIRKDIGVNGPRDEIFQLSELQISRLPLFMMQRNDIAKDPFLWRWRETLNLLESYSIISIGGSQENLSFSMHPLAHAWTRVRHGLASRKEGWRAAGSVIALSMRELSYNMFHEKLRSHVGSYLDHPIDEYMAGMMELETCQTQSNICYLIFHVHAAPKLRFLLQILQTFEAWTGASGESRLHVQTLTARCLMGEGEHGKAVELLEQLVKHDRSHSIYAQCVLAEAYMASKQHQNAVTLLKDIVEIRKRTQVPEDARLLWSQYELGRAYIGTTQFERAAKLLEQVVERRKRTLVPTHPDLLASQHELAIAYIGMGSGHYGKAAELLKHVIKIRGETLASDDPRLLWSQQWLEKVHRLIEAEKDAESTTDSREMVSHSS